MRSLTVAAIAIFCFGLLACKSKDPLEVVTEDLEEQRGAPEDLAAQESVTGDVVEDLPQDVVPPDVSEDSALLEAVEEVEGKDIPAVEDLVEPDVCVPECEGKECGDDGCGGACGTCEAGCTCDASGQCLGCGDEFEEIIPTCVHVPYLVGAGQTFPIAVFAETPNCAEYSHYKVENADGGLLKVKLLGKKMDGPCPPCYFNYWGIIWVGGLEPGPHLVQVADQPAQYMVASAGDIPDVACDAACISIGDGWKLTYLDEPDTISVGCGTYPNQDAPAVFDGGCQTYTLECEDWTGPTDVMACNDTDFFFDVGTDDTYATTATRCVMPWEGDEEVMVGVTLKDGGNSAEMFLFEK